MNAIWKALAHLYPHAQPFVDFEIRTGDDGHERIAVWNLPGSPPTDAALLAAITAYDAAQATQAAEATALRQQVVSLAQSAVGQSIAGLTAAQVRALLALLLFNAGAITAQGTVKPLSDWVDNG